MIDYQKYMKTPTSDLNHIWILTMINLRQEIKRNGKICICKWLSTIITIGNLNILILVYAHFNKFLELYLLKLLDWRMV